MMWLIADAILPIAGVLAVGVLIRQKRWIDESMWRGLEWLSYWVLMPSLLISAIARAPQIEVPWLSLLGALYGTLAILSIVGLAGWRLRWFGDSFSAFTSVYQGFIRFNTFVSLALMAGLDATRLPHLAIAAACIIVVINFACVTVMSLGHADASLRRVLFELLRNPLILACVFGGVTRWLGAPSTFPISGLALLGQAALPIGILVLGAGLDWQAFRRALGLTVTTSVVQLGVKPFLFLALAMFFGVPAEWVLVGLLLMSVSTAPSSFILAKQLGGDAGLMAGIVATQTLLVMVTVPVVLALASLFGWISL